MAKVKSDTLHVKGIDVGIYTVAARTLTATLQWSSPRGFPRSSSST